MKRFVRRFVEKLSRSSRAVISSIRLHRFCWFEIVTIPLGVIAGSSIHLVGALTLGIAHFALVLWIYRSLIRPDIREQFRNQSALE